MDEENVSRGNPRNTKGRFGIKTNKTLKYNRGEVYRRRKDPESIVLMDLDEVREIPRHHRVTAVDLGTGFNINSRKNWEVLENNRNSLRTSQDDIDIDYAPRVVVLEIHDKPGKRDKQKVAHEIHGSGEEKSTEEQTVAGTNRKGFFVKEKRKKGKRGVHKTHERSGLGKKMSKSDNEESESESDSAIDDPAYSQEKNEVLLVQVHPKHPDFVHKRTDKGCGCGLCTGGKNQEHKKRQLIQDISDL